MDAEGGVASVNKEQAYQELISDVKKFYIAQEAEHHNESVYLTWYDNCEEINLSMDILAGTGESRRQNHAGRAGLGKPCGRI